MKLISQGPLPAYFSGLSNFKIVTILNGPQFTEALPPARDAKPVEHFEILHLILCQGRKLATPTFLWPIEDQVMPRTVLAYNVADVSKAARSIRQQLLKLERAPSHLELLNILARSAGFRNFQHFRSRRDEMPELEPLPIEVSPVDTAAVEQTARFFNAEGQLTMWPSKESRARLCMWVIWSQFPSGSDMAEKDVNEWLKKLNSFGDHALLRRALVDFGLCARTASGNCYRRIEQQPPAELRPLLRLIGRNNQGELST